MGQHAILTYHTHAQRDGLALSNEGGAVHQVDPMTVVRRFLILGSTGTFYATAPAVTKLATGAVEAAITADPVAVHDLVWNTNQRNLALRRDPLLWTLARLTMPDIPLDIRRSSAINVATICRTGTELLHWIAYRRAMGKSNRTFRSAIANWFLSRTPDDLALQAVKYDQRDGWSMRDALRLAKPKAPSDAYAAVFDWMAHPDKRGYTAENQRISPLFDGYAALRQNVVPDGAPAVIRSTRLPREAVPGEILAHREAWEALLPDMPAQALVRNLGKLSSLGIPDTTDRMIDITNRIRVAAPRLHPFQFLMAAKVYAQGHGERGKLSWYPQPDITNELMAAFGLSFGSLTVDDTAYPLIALDASSSMQQSAGGTVLSCHEAEAALAMVLAYQYPNAVFVKFSHRLEIMPIHGLGFGEVLARVRAWDGGGTFCDLPLLMAEGAAQTTAAIMVTDSETWHRQERPSGIVRRIHQTRPDFRFACVAMATNDISVADDRDPKQMNLVGMSADLPRALTMFLANEA